MSSSLGSAWLSFLLALAMVAVFGESAWAQTAKMQRPITAAVGRTSTPTRMHVINNASSSASKSGPSTRRSGVSTASIATQSQAHLSQAQLAPTVMHGMPFEGTAESILIDDGTMLNPSLIDGNACDSCGSEFCCCNPAGYLIDWTRADLWAGTTGFVGPGNFITSGANSAGAVEGSFGFQEGVNFGSRVPSLLCGQMGAQLGLRFVQAQLDGSAAGTDNRQQTFATAGMFRRVDYGVQAGLVVDYLHDDWIYQADLLQLRGEVSYLLTPCHELGFRLTDSQQTDAITASLASSNTPITPKLAALNTYRFFYRYRYGELGRGLAELQAGWTETSGTVLGIDLKTPLQNQLGLATSVTYVIPNEDASLSFASEGWNLSMAIVWTPGRGFGQARDYYRPLFDVADNGSLLSRIANN